MARKATHGHARGEPSSTNIATRPATSSREAAKIGLLTALDFGQLALAD
jgi:hypothetical protein